MLPYKVPLILAAAPCNYLAWTPPNPPAPKDRRVSPTRGEKFFQWASGGAHFAAKTLSSASFLAELAVILARSTPSSNLSKKILSFLIFRGDSSTADVLRIANKIQVTRPFIIGCALVISGGLLRLSCYRELGRFFTFEMSVLKDHTLVTTGPYRFVRHPSYLAIAPILVGMTLAQMTRGSWLTESGAMDTYTGKILVCLWQLWGWYCWYQTLARTPIEDEYLRKRFGQQWTDWQKKVPYRVLPGIF